MSYRKIGDGNPILTHTGGGVQKEMPPVDEVIDKITSFIRCPECGNSEVYSPCNCYPQNFACLKCGWLHNNHTHQADMAGVTQKDISQSSLIAATTRK